MTPPLLGCSTAQGRQGPGELRRHAPASKATASRGSSSDASPPLVVHSTTLESAPQDARIPAEASAVRACRDAHRRAVSDGRAQHRTRCRRSPRGRAGAVSRQLPHRGRVALAGQQPVSRRADPGGAAARASLSRPRSACRGDERHPRGGGGFHVRDRARLARAGSARLAPTVRYVSQRSRPDRCVYRAMTWRCRCQR